jgi:SsrA-binding protein
MQTNKNHIKIVTNNKKASFNYFLDEFFECGLVLTGTEIKSIRNHNPSLSDSYALIRNGEAFLINMNIPVYDKGNIFNHEPLRQRKLLLHKEEIRKLQKKIDQQGYTLVPTKLYLKEGLAKIEIALARGKKMYDKRETIKENDIKREIAKNIKGRSY